MTTVLEPTNLPDAQNHSERQMPTGVGEPNLPQPTHHSKTRHHPAAAPNFPDAQARFESQTKDGVGEPNLPQPSVIPKAMKDAVAASNLLDAQWVGESQKDTGVGDQDLPQPTHCLKAIRDAAAAPNFPDAQGWFDSQGCAGVGDQTTEGGALGPILADDTLAMCADVVDDLEHVRKANENRLRQLTRPFDEVDADGNQRGHGLTLDHPDVARLSAIVDAITAAEHQAVLNLQRVMRKHPLGPFVKNSKGIGEKQAARLLASIGDPYWNDLHNRPRRLRELYRFCGMDVVGTSAHCGTANQPICGAGVAPTKQRGERVHWNPDARMRLWLIASKCVMVGHGGPYRDIYDQGRLKYAEAVHTVECRRCGPKGKPAQPGTPLSAGHQNARAIRLIAKAILRDLWTEAKNIHEQKAAQQ